MLQVAQQSFRNFNAIQEEADISLCNAICVKIEMADEGWFIERLRYDIGEGVYVQLPEHQELIVVVYRGEITIHLNLKYDCQELVEKYGLTHCPGEEFEYRGFAVVGSIEKVVKQVYKVMDCC